MSRTESETRHSYNLYGTEITWPYAVLTVKQKKPRFCAKQVTLGPWLPKNKWHLNFLIKDC